LTPNLGVRNAYATECDLNTSWASEKNPQEYTPRSKHCKNVKISSPEKRLTPRDWQIASAAQLLLGKDRK
jgi:hypothetical protein